MSLGDLNRINSNQQARESLTALNRVNGRMAQRQMRLATGSRINQAEDDSAGYSIAKKLEARVRGQAQALSNIGDAKGMLTVAEGSLNSVMDILQTMKEKTVQAANDTMGTSEREAIQNQLDALTLEITDTLGSTTFNGTNLFSGTSTVSLNYQVNAESGDSFGVTINAIATSTLGAGITGTTSLNAISVTGSAASVRDQAIASIDHAITQVADQLANLGDSQKRLSFKQENLSTSMSNYESSRSRIADADFAQEQMEIVKLQILQQTGTASLAQANSGPQSILSLIGG